MIIDNRMVFNVEMISGNVVKMVTKEPSELENTTNGKLVILNFFNGELFVGLFNGIDNGEILLKSPGLKINKATIGLPYNKLQTVLSEL